MQRLEVSGAVRPIYGSLGVKRLRQQQKKTDAEWHGVAPPFARPLTSTPDSVLIKAAQQRGSIGRFINTVQPERLRRLEI